MPGPTTTAPAPSPSTTVVVAPDGDPGASPVEGLDARAAAGGGDGRALGPGPGVSGPVAESVTLSDGTVVWRVWIPGSFPVRGVWAVVTVDGGPRAGRLAPCR